MKRIILLLGILFWSWGVSPSKAKEPNGIKLHLSPVMEPPAASGNLALRLKATSERPVPIRINFWSAVQFVLEDANGKTLEWTNSGSDSLRTPPPPEAIPSLGDSGVVDLSITVTPGTTEKEGVSASFILVRTKWGLVWNRTSLPEGDLYLRAKVKGNRHLDPSSFLYYAITKGIGKEGYAQIYEGHLLSNPVRLHRSEDGRLTASAPEAR